MGTEGGLKTAPARRSRGGREVLLVANARASGLADGKKLELAVRALRARGGVVEPILTRTPDELAATMAETERRVILLGGDGTVHTVANLPGRLPELALLPAGRANNVARSLGIPVDLGTAAALAVEGAARPIDAIDARTGTGTYRVVEGVSIGFHAQARVNYRAQNSAALGRGVAAGLGALWKFRPVLLVVQSDGVNREMSVGQLFAANLPLYGFGMRVAPGAEPGDGELDLVTIEAPSRRSVVAMLPRVRRGSHYGLPGVRTWRARNVRVDARGASPVIGDSTNLGRGPVELTVVPAALEVVRP